MAQTAEQKAAAKAARDAKKAAALAAATPGAQGAVANVPTPTVPSKTAVTVKHRDHKGETVERTFSKEVHGEDFAKLADEFKANPNNKIIE